MKIFLPVIGVLCSLPSALAFVVPLQLDPRTRMRPALILRPHSHDGGAVDPAPDIAALVDDLVQPGMDESVPLPSTTDEEHVDEEEADKEEIDEETAIDMVHMREAIQMAQSAGGERGAHSAFPNPTAGAVLAAKDGRILGKGRSNFVEDSVQAAIADAGLKATPLSEWRVTWPSSRQLREDIAESTLYVTLEPQSERRGQSQPPITQLIELSGIPRVVIGCPDPIPDFESKGAAALHAAGIAVRMGILEQECRDIIPLYSELANSKLRRMARTHFRLFGRPLGFLHCSVVDSNNIQAFARHGNAFGKDFGGKVLSFREFGSYEIAPPPEVVWADDQPDEEDDFETEVDNIFELEFEDEDFQGMMSGNPMMPWYEQADAVVATFPRPGNGPQDDQSLSARLNGLKWLATHGEELPAGVERIIVMDATDLKELPLTNDHPDLNGEDMETFWTAHGRKPTRVLLRRGQDAQAKAAAEAAAIAAESAAKAAMAARDAIETGDAAHAAEAAVECQQAAQTAIDFIEKELQVTLEVKRKLNEMGVHVETIHGGEPIDVMKHLGERSGLHSVVWRAGCWGERGVQSILAGAFQWVSAHLAVDAIGGKFWQLMLAERAVQAACGPTQKVKIFADQEDISLEYCDEEEADGDCVLTVDGRPVRHVRLDCRIALVDEKRPREFILAKTKRLDRKAIEEKAPWFI